MNTQTFAFLMDGININLGFIVIPAVAIALVVALAITIKVAASRYVKVAPDELAVFSGRKYRYKATDGTVQSRGFFLLQGGGKILMPIVETVKIIKTGAFQVPVEESNVPNKDNVGVTVKGVATCRLSVAESDMANMVTNFLDKSENERIAFIQNILKGHVRSIVGNLTIDELLRNRQQMNEQVVNESTPELKRLGIDVINLVIQDVRDDLGYIVSLGKRQVAEALRDAQVATANAQKETDIQVSTAAREAAEAKAQNETKTADANRLRDIQIADFKTQTETKRAVSENAFGIASAEQQKTLRVAEAVRDKAAAEANTDVQAAEALRNKAQLEATVITAAEAEAKSAVIKATGLKNAASLEAERATTIAQGDANASIQKATGEAKSIQLTAEATATATRATKSAEAEGNKALTLAAAAGKEADLLATAKGISASKTAEATGVAAMSEAMGKLSPQGQMLLIMDRLPALFDKGGDAGAKIMQAIFEPIGEGVAKIGNVQITDLGGGAATEKGITAIGGLVPKIALDFFATAKAAGIDVSPLLSYLKMDPKSLVGMLSPAAPVVDAETTTTPAK